MIQYFLKVLILSIFIIPTIGCANFGKKFKAFLNGGSDSAPVARKSAARRRPTFKSNPNYNGKIPHRNYKRVTKKKLENTSRLDSRSGSLWVMEGQGAYLFSQNIMRMIGDPISVRIEGEPKQQLENKVSVIKKLLAKLEERKRRALRRTAGGPDKKTAKRKPASKPATAAKSATSKSGDTPFKVKSVPTRIVERLVDGNYRVKGSQVFMIGTREYKAIVTGVVRSEDFSDEGIAAPKLLDSKFDIVSVRRPRGRM